MTSQGYQEHRARLERVVAQILRDPDEAQDIASESFLAMLERGPRDDAATLAWLLTTAKRRAFNRSRDEARASRRAMCIVDSPEPMPELVDDRLLQVVRAALSGLSVRDRIALEMRFVSEEPLERISVALGIGATATRVAIHRAVRRLRRSIVWEFSKHHAVPRSCSDKLMKSAESGKPVGHPRCGACVAVTDEIAALGLVPAVSPTMLRKVGEALQNLTGTMRFPRGAVTSRSVEGFTALALTATLISPLGTGSLSPSPASRAGVARSAGERPLDHAHLAARSATQPPRRLDAARSVSRVTDAPGVHNAPTEAIRPPVLRSVGPISRIFDAVLGSDASYDLTEFQIATTADERGNPEGLVFRLILAGRPTPSGQYSVAWNFTSRERSCSAEAMSMRGEGVMGPNQTIGFSCWSGAPGDLLNTPQESWSIEHKPAYGSRWIEMRLPFNALPASISDGITPGATITAVRAVTYRTSPGAAVGVDQAPDHGNHAYEISR